MTVATNMSGAILAGEVPRARLRRGQIRLCSYGSLQPPAFFLRSRSSLLGRAHYCASPSPPGQR